MKKKPHFRNKPARDDGFRSGHTGRDRSESQAKTNLIYGVLPVLEALRARARKIDKIIIGEGIRESRLNEIVELARSNGILINSVSKDQLTKIAGSGVNHQGVIAIAAAAAYWDVEDVLDSVGKDALIVVLDGVEDPQNLGAILRVAECAGADSVIIPERRAVGLSETVAKASAGAIEYVKVGKVSNLNRLIEDLKERELWVVGTSGDAEMNYTDWDWSRPTALVLGGEGHGLHRLVAENCDVLVKIPMYGKIESLNVSSAASVILFEARRQRRAVKE
jgi:23S rRNA (guanosine2251-2'-O)-methyltransferase